MSDETLPEFRVQVTTSMVVRAALAARDWQPQHHDPVWSRNEARLRDIIMDNYTQTGLLSRYVTGWAGPSSRIGRVKLRMRHSICPGDELLISGRIQATENTAQGFHWYDLEVRLEVCGEVATEATMRLAVPDTPGSDAAWQCPPGDWRP